MTRGEPLDLIKKIPLDVWTEFEKQVFDDEHFRYKTIGQFKCKWNLLYSARNDGKSAAACADETLKRLFVHGYKFLYIRRYEREATAWKVERYFMEDCFREMLHKIMYYISGMSSDDLVDIRTRAYAGEIFIEGFDRTISKWRKLGTMGYYCSIERYIDRKSQQFDNVRTVLYEEFLATDRPELEDEFEGLLNTISTYTRDNDFEAILVGNTVKRRSSIFDGFNVNPDKIPLGIVQTYTYEKDGKVNTLAVLHIPETKSRKKASTSFYFGDRQKTNLIGDEWYISDYQRIPEKYKYNSFKPAASFLILCSQIKLYIYFVEDICLCSNDRLCDNEYFVLTDRTDIKKHWLSLAANPNIVDRIAMFRAHNWVYFSDNNAGDDLDIFLTGNYAKGGKKV